MTDACIIGIDKTNLDDCISSNKTEIEVYDLVRLCRSRREEGVACYAKKSNSYNNIEELCKSTGSIFVNIFFF